MAWRGRTVDAERWPSRVDAFLTACALHAGQRESDLLNIVRELGEGLEQAAQRKQMTGGRR